MFTLCFDGSAKPQPGDKLFCFNDAGQILVQDAATALLDVACLSRLKPGRADMVHLGSLADGGETRNVWLLPEAETVPDGWTWQTPRLLLRDASAEAMVPVFRAFHVHSWLDRFRHCARCGQGYQRSKHELALVCPACQDTLYPVISPAIIVAITRNGGSELLLAKSAKSQSGWRSLIAGYCEAGEAIEQTVEREVMEETGLRVKNLRYRNSQSWPFSQSLMLGFTAEWAAGEIEVDAKELAEADWFPVERLPETPPPPSIAAWLIALAKSEYEQKKARP